MIMNARWRWPFRWLMCSAESTAIVTATMMVTTAINILWIVIVTARDTNVNTEIMTWTAWTAWKAWKAWTAWTKMNFKEPIRRQHTVVGAVTTTATATTKAAENTAMVAVKSTTRTTGSAIKRLKSTKLSQPTDMMKNI